MSYPELQAHLAEKYGWSFEQIDDMSFEQISSALDDGKKPKGIIVKSADDVKEINKHWRKMVGI